MFAYPPGVALPRGQHSKSDVSIAGRPLCVLMTGWPAIPLTPSSPNEVVCCAAYNSPRVLFTTAKYFFFFGPMAESVSLVVVQPSRSATRDWNGTST